MPEIDLTRRTKIVATIGPATESSKRIKELVKAGATTFRLNFSHGDHHEHSKRIDTIRDVSSELGVHIGILQDLQGPKIRVGEFVKPLKLKKGAEVTFSTKKKRQAVYINYTNFAKDVNVNDRVLIDDGKIALSVITTNNKDTVKLKVVFGGKLMSNKGVTLPNTKISLPCLTKKDKKDLKLVLFRVSLDR